MVELIRQNMIESFVRDELGCQCPDDVFKQIESSEETKSSIAYQRVGIGGRLLVYLSTSASIEQLKCLLTKGRDERDLLGFSRFRFAVVDDAHFKVSEGLPQVELLDDKVHLHLIAPSVLNHYI